MSQPPAPQAPSLPWRLSSATIMGLTGILSRGFLYGLNSVEVTGLSRFLDILDSRRDIEKRQRGLLTISNHVSVLDDPIIWGLLPTSYGFNPSNLRWTLGAHDICFKTKFLTRFFTLGQVLPAHRSKHSEFGGPFQPSITQAICLLSAQPFSPPPLSSPGLSDPFTTGALTYTTNGADTLPSPAYFPCNRHSWVHVFPEGLVHQHPSSDLRYFKWGVARLILEADPPPDVLPMFIDGTQRCMPERRTFPRFAPRVGKRIRVAFGEVLDYEATFGDLRRRWDGLVKRSRVGGRWRAGAGSGGHVAMLGELPNELKHSKEAQEIRIEVARRIRDEVLKVRRALGYPEPDPLLGDAATWRADDEIKAKKYKSRVDGSEINQD
ncbi:acyltransferase-like protein [Lasiosphaeris hirsuta]|uniref:Tafazzin family protein n=1 Tax=Lasiosphaeris hirsuta TaxID=260670 RepID=A0AA40A8X9_9PEZI|nr:acyltransferase-like protein [Lasiosphaeris hirsuta]